MLRILYIFLEVLLFRHFVHSVCPKLSTSHQLNAANHPCPLVILIIHFLPSVFDSGLRYRSLVTIFLSFIVTSQG